MINRLYIKNYALIEELDIRFSDKLTVVTGETGAGKSIMLGALGLVMGKRADTRVLYNESEKCIVEGYFDIRTYDLRGFFEENDLDYEDDLVIRREITPAGKSRAFINDSPAVLDVVQKLCDSLLDLHQQFDTLDVYDVSFQLQVIDSLADNRERLKAYRQQYKQYRTAASELARLRDDNARSVQEMEFLQFQADEFRQAELQPGEQASLEKELEILSNAESIKKAADMAYRALADSDRSLADQLDDINRNVAGVSRYHKGLADLSERIVNLSAEIRDIGSDMERIADATEFDGERILDMQNRVSLIYKLLKKHNASDSDQLLDIWEGIENRLKSFGNISGEIERLEGEVAKLEASLRTQAVELNKHREAVREKFEGAVMGLLSELSMADARIQVDIKQTETLLPTGMDEVKFLFSANRSSRLEDIKGIASGGELSRLAFCIKSLVAKSIPLPTLIFDEIDSGVSGDVAMRMGNILQRLSAGHQVLVITHSPQVASQGDVHYFVYKRQSESRAISEIRQLEREERIIEIAKMLSGNPPSEIAKQNARELMGMNPAHK